MAHKIIKYQCDFCKKSFTSKSYAEKQHEPICFYNPKSESCITCNHLDLKWYLEGKQMTHEEHLILQYKVPGTFTQHFNTDPESDGEEYNLLNDEYQYLYDYQPENFCQKQQKLLKRLCTNCSFYTESKPF